MKKDEKRKEIQKRADKLLSSIKDELLNCRILADVDRLGRLVTLFHYHTSYELMKMLRDKGMDSDISKLAIKAGEKLR